MMAHTTEAYVIVSYDTDGIHLYGDEVFFGEHAKANAEKAADGPRSGLSVVTLDDFIDTLRYDSKQNGRYEEQTYREK